MAKLKKREKILLGVIGVTVIVFSVMDPYYVLWKDPPPPEELVPEDGIETVEIENDEGEIIKVSRRPKIAKINFPNWGRDPFVQTKRYLDIPLSIHDMKLTGISVSGKQRVALINSRVVREGDDINGMRVAQILKDKVIMSNHGKKFVVSLGGR